MVRLPRVSAAPTGQSAKVSELHYAQYLRANRMCNVPSSRDPHSYGGRKRVAQSHRCRRPRCEGCRLSPCGFHLMGAPRKTKGWRSEGEVDTGFPGYLPAAGLGWPHFRLKALLSAPACIQVLRTPAPPPGGKSSRDPDPHNLAPVTQGFPQPWPTRSKRSLH